MAFASSTEVPPNFMTIIGEMNSCERCEQTNVEAGKPMRRPSRCPPRLVLPYYSIEITLNFQQFSIEQRRPAAPRIVL